MKSVVFSMIAALAAMLPVVTASAADKSTKTPAASDHMIQKFDKNGDGALDATELAAAMAQHQAHHKAKSGKTVKATKGPATDAAKAEMLIKRFDANGDGKLDASELKTMRAAHKSGT